MNKRVPLIKSFICTFSLISIIVILLVGCINNYNYLEYEINSDEKTYTVVGYKGQDNTDVVIPETYRGRAVTKIADNAFKDTMISSIYIPSSIQSIGEGAFSGCTLLQAVYGLEECSSLKQIRNKTFYFCESLEYIKLPDNITVIGEKAFMGCIGLENIVLPNGLQFIEMGAFAMCESLKEIHFPRSVIKIGWSAFVRCHSLKEITIPPFMSNDTGETFIDCVGLLNINAPEDSLNYSSIDGVLYDKYQRYLHFYPSGRQIESYIIPMGTTHITGVAFAFNQYLKEITIPKSVTHIFSCILYQSENLTNIKYDGTVKEWQSIDKLSDWDEESADYIIYCTDGQIAKDGTVTYN